MTLLINYGLQLLPGLIVLSTIYILLPAREKLLQMVILILGFILMRDAMTPAGIWQFGISDGVMWIRFIESHFILLTLAFLSVILSFIILQTHVNKKEPINWLGKHRLEQALFAGIVGSLIAAGPFLIPYFFTPLAERGGAVPWHLMPTLLIFTLGGNFLEEVLFRELLQGYLQQHTSSSQAILLSGLFFAAGHIFLATTVTNLGPLILVFTFWEGLICAWLKPRYGLLSATVAHGLTIFLLAAGLF